MGKKKKMWAGFSQEEDVQMANKQNEKERYIMSLLIRQMSALKPQNLKAKNKNTD